MSAILAFWDLRIKEEQIVMCVRMLKLSHCTRLVLQQGLLS